jgi:hypothetical protein
LFPYCLDRLLKPTILQRIQQTISRHQFPVKGRVAAIRQNDYRPPSQDLSKFATQRPVQRLVQIRSADRFRMYQFRDRPESLCAIACPLHLHLEFVIKRADCNPVLRT